MMAGVSMMDREATSRYFAAVGDSARARECLTGDYDLSVAVQAFSEHWRKGFESGRRSPTKPGMTDDELRSIIHYATHEALPSAKVESDIYDRARIQVAIADAVIGAIRASEHGADSFGGLFFHES